MPWIIALEAARRMKANRQMTAVRRNDKRDQLKSLYKYSSTKGALAPRFLSKSKAEKEAIVLRVRKELKKKRLVALCNTVVTVAIVACIIYFSMR